MTNRIVNCWANAVIHDLEDRGIKTDGLLAAARLQRSAVEIEDGWISFASHCQLFESAALATDDDLYGARFGLSVDPLLAGLLAYIGFNSEQLGDALKNMARYPQRCTASRNCWRRAADPYLRSGCEPSV